MSARVDKIYEQIANGGGNPRVVDELMCAFLNGYPLARLKKLIHTDVSTAQGDAAWILSEIGELGIPFVSDCRILLKSPSFKARYFALDVVVVRADATMPDILAQASALINDKHPSVRWKAMGFLARLTQPQLQAAVFGQQYDSVLRAQLNWLCGAGGALESELLQRLREEEAIYRSVAIVAARRHLSKFEKILRVTGLESVDEVVRRFCSTEIELMDIGKSNQ